MGQIRLLLFSVISVVFCVQAQPVSKGDVPFIGAQFFIEPGQSDAQVNSWFAAMECANMTVCRIRMFQQYMEREDGTWDFSLFDRAFDSALRHHVRVYATLFPTGERTDIDGWKFPTDEAQQLDFARFIKAVVTHYHAALKGWVILNEPGCWGDPPHTPFCDEAWNRWQQEHPDSFLAVDGYPNIKTPRRQAFTYDFTAGYLNWIANEVRRYDSRHDIHVNPADIFGNIGDYWWEPLAHVPDEPWRLGAPVVALHLFLAPPVRPRNDA